MKSFLCYIGLLLAVVFSPHASTAQALLNGGFETTRITVNDTIPEHWSMDYFGSGFTTDAHSGSQAVVIWNWYHYARAWLTYGDATTPSTSNGLPVSFNPDKLSGYYKYIYGDNDGAADSAYCEIFLWSHQGFSGARDTIAQVTHLLGPVGEYTAFEIPITYRISGMLADSISVRFHSSTGGFCGLQSSGYCLYLYLDDVEISTATGLQQSLMPSPTATLFPSPSASGFKILSDETGFFPCDLALYDLSGKRLFQQHDLPGSHEAIQPQLPAAEYIWQVVGHNGKQHTGRILLQ